ncbi:MAG: DnaJ domain-containing protein [archaeon]|nr:DnaJ domain-containing protein [archaeon]
MPHQNYYEILELPRDCTLEDIAEAFRRLSLKYHPKNSTSENTAVNSYKFHRIAEAYEVLSDPNKKGIYDIYGYEGLSNGILTPAGELKGGYKYSGNAHEIFQKFMGTSNPFALIRDTEKNDDDWGSAFISAYGGKKEKERTKVSPIEVILECSLEELYKGTIKQITYKRNILDYNMRTTREIENQMDIEIFPGYDKDTVLTFPKMGNEFAGEETSDLIVKIKEKKHNEFKRVNGKDLIFTKTLTLAQALNSEPVKFTTLDNRVMSVSMDEIISPQSVKVVPGEGMPIYSKEIDVNDLSVKKGDLYIKFNIIFPEFIDPDKKEKIIKLLETEEE